MTTPAPEIPIPPLPSTNPEPVQLSDELFKLVTSQASELKEDDSAVDLTIQKKVVFRNRKPRPETYGQDPPEDRYGQAKWVATRECWCSASAETDCRFHSVKEKGWEVCPSKPQWGDAPGKMLYATNPLYGKRPEGYMEPEQVEDESVAVET